MGYRGILLLTLIALSVTGCATPEGADLVRAAMTVAVVEVVDEPEPGVYRVAVLDVPLSRHDPAWVNPQFEYCLDVIPPVQNLRWPPGQRLVVFATGSLITAPHKQAIWEVNDQGEINVPGGGINAPANIGELPEWLKERM